MIFKINNVDIVPWIAQEGIKWQRYDIDAPKAGRTMDGRMQRGRVATKIKMTINCVPLTGNDLHTLLNLISPEYVSVEYDDPQLGHRVATFYANNNPATYFVKRPTGIEWWSEISFPLVER